MALTIQDGLTANISGGAGSGTVTTVSVVTANGVSGSVANASTTPAITLTLGAITPTSVTTPVVILTSANVVTDSTTSRTFSNADNGTTVVFTNAAAISGVINTGLTAGWSVNIVVAGAGQLTLSGTATLNARNGLKSAGQYAMMAVAYMGATDTYVVGGDTST